MKKNLIFLIIIILTSVAFFCLGNLVQSKKTESIITDLKNRNQSLKEQIKNDNSISDNKDELNNIDLNETKHSIDIEEEKCINSTHPYMYSDCAKQSEKLWDLEIDKCIKLTKEIMSDKDTEVVKQSQADWEKSATSDIIMINKFISSRQGTINETLGFSYISDIKKERALLLQKIYENYKEELESQKN